MERNEMDYGSIPRVTDENSTDNQSTITEVLDDSFKKKRIWLNVCLVNFAYFLLYMGVIPVSMIQSSFNHNRGLGVMSLAVKSGFMVVGCFVAPSIIQKFGCKSALIVGNLLYITYIPANFYPSWWTLIPFAVLAGLGCTVGTVAHKVYLAKLAHLYANLTNSDVVQINSRIFVLFAVSLKASGSVGNFVSSLILGVGNENNGTSEHVDESRLQHCGIRFCYKDLHTCPSNETGFESSGIEEQHFFKVLVVIVFCTVSGVMSIVAFNLVDPLKRLGLVAVAAEADKSPLAVFKDLLRAMTDLRHICFIPTTMALSGGDSFWMADFTKAFITCAIGMGYLGYVTVWNGLSGIVACLLLGWFNNRERRSFPILFATMLQLATLTSLYFWEPARNTVTENYWTLSVFGILFFFGSGIRHFFSPVLISVVFPGELETAFSVFHFWVYFSATLFFTWSTILCTSFKIYFLMVIVALGFVGYIGMEVLVRNSDKKNELLQSDEDN